MPLKTVLLTAEELHWLKKQQELVLPDTTLAELLVALQREQERVRVLRVALHRMITDGDEQSARAALEVTSN